MPERRAAAWALAGLPLLAAAGPAPALEDPMRPPAYAPRQAPAASSTKGWRLQAVFRGPAGMRALVNGKLVGVGDRVDGARVVAIGARGVELATPEGRRKLRLVRTRILRRTRQGGERP